MVTLIDVQLRPLVKGMSTVQAKSMATRAISDAVNEVMSNENFDYNALTNLKSDASGNVIALQADMVNTNQLKNKIEKAVQQKLLDYSDRTISIPIGTFLGSDLLMGRGPKIKMKITLYGNVITNINSTFESAGINQTKHQIMCTVKAGISVIIPGYNSYTEVETNFIVAESVIVGDIPNSYSNINVDEVEESLLK
jgi:sporulation protein YunB